MQKRYRLVMTGASVGCHGSHVPRVSVFLALVFVVLLGVLRGEASTLCAQASIQISSSMTLERQAFDAMMRIQNGLEGVAISNVTVTLQWLNAQRQPVTATTNPNNTNALFYYRLDSLQNIAAASNGVVAAGQTAEIHWLIIPAPGAGGTNADGVTYYVGATLQYKIRDQLETVEVDPDYIVVRPMPRLTLDYFLPGPVYGDDPFTPAIEEAIPFALGLRIRNSGSGVAQRLKIEAAQPEIVQNQLGLLVGFQIQGCEVQGVPGPKGLLVDFGSLAPRSAKMARWIMTASLVGQFTNFTASFTHADTLGGELTSLIEAVNTHRLVKDVMVDIAGRDRIADFLARDGLALRVYESDNQDLAVSDHSGQSDLQYWTGEGETYQYKLVIPATNETVYVEKSFPPGAAVEVAEVARGDGKRLNPANVWISKTRDRGTDPWQYWFHLFDADGGGQYSITFRARSGYQNRPPVLAYIGRKVTREGEQLGFLIEASDPEGLPVELRAMPLPAGAEFTVLTNGMAYFYWAPSPGQYGVYPVRFEASDGELTDWEIVRIYVGRVGEELCDGLPCSLKDWCVEIKELLADAGSNVATVKWDSAEGLLYEVWAAEDAFAGTGRWFRVGGIVAGAGTREVATDGGLGTNVGCRYYKVALAGEEVDTNKLWAVVRGRGEGRYILWAPPVRTDGRMDGDLGRLLARNLVGSADGSGDGAYVLTDTGEWKGLYLDEQGQWRDIQSGTLATTRLAAGQGIYIKKAGGGTWDWTFTGPVGNDGTMSHVVRSGWNLLGLCEGKPVKVQEIFESIAHGGGSEDEADVIVTQDGQGRWRRWMYVEGWGAPYDGHWFDLTTYTIVPADATIQPGQAFYYLRRGESVDLRF